MPRGLLHSATFGGPTGSPDLVVLHGMLGSSRNWSLVAKELSGFATVHTLDLPGHGQSRSLPAMDFPGMAAAVVNWLDAEAFEKVHLLGHSLGGKLAMWVASEFPSRLESLIVADIVPKDYPPHSQEILEAMARLDLISILSRRDAEDAMLDAIPDLGMRKFVLTNLVRGEDQQFFWQADIHGLLRSLPALSSNPMAGKAPHQGKTLFIRGGESNYFRPADEAGILQYFPNSAVQTIPEAGHNVHFDDIPAFVSILRSHLDV
jgi:esterase